ncbi:hypothetical protein [Candidatus Bodocaedibacter vickermanii]|uniref:Uncharacterized protein n=1 Tax=Candidatus Bodocaedibacter vickermanii TaxID=2741701 RepID=A0A7L9RTG0_9PROT|nr:hypothetical protein CPBP_00668 [Candidatus Paracaedibacteraceae bacterium 'Lake Konstanz']
MRLCLLASIATLSVVFADSQSSFLIETDTVSSFLRPDTCDHFSEAVMPHASYQNEDVAQLHPLEEAAAVETEQMSKSLITNPPKESWWAYSKRLAWRVGGVAYQYLRSNRLTGVESGSCQSWTSLTKLKNIGENWRVNSKQHFLLGKNGESVISTPPQIETLSMGFESATLRGMLKQANTLQRETKTQKVYLPLNLYLTNYVSGEKIIHRVTLEAVYNDAGIATSVKILDPQTALSGGYLSDARALCEEAFAGLKSKNLTTEYNPVGIQMPGTGNCQKMAAYIAVALGEGQAVEDLTLNKANTFCTELHVASEKSSSKSSFLGSFPRLW